MPNTLTSAPAINYAGQGGWCSIGSRFTPIPLSAGQTLIDITNLDQATRWCCPVYVTGSRVRFCFAMIASSGATPNIAETPTAGAVIRCSFEAPDGSIVQAFPVKGTPTGADGMSIAALGGQLVYFEANVPVTKGEIWWVRCYAVKNAAADQLPNVTTVSTFGTNTVTNPLDAWGDGIVLNGHIDLTAGGVVAVNNTLNASAFGPCAVLVIPSNPLLQANATFIGVNDSTGIGQSDVDSWRHGWAGRELLAKGRPGLLLGCQGEASSAATITQFSIRNQLMAMCGKYAFIGDGWNDLIISGAGASATVIANKLLFAKFANAAGCVSCPMTLWPGGTSTDNWSTTGNESPPAYEAGRLAINADARNPGTPGIYTGPCLDMESYLKGLNGANIVPAPVNGLTTPWGTGVVSSVGGGTITPTGPTILVAGVAVALNGSDANIANAANFAGGSNIVMTSGTNIGTVYPVTGNNGALFAVSGSTAGISGGDTFRLYYQASQGVHLPSRQQLAISQFFPMHHALGWA